MAKPTLMTVYGKNRGSASEIERNYVSFNKHDSVIYRRVRQKLADARFDGQRPSMSLLFMFGLAALEDALDENREITNAPL